MTKALIFLLLPFLSGATVIWGKSGTSAYVKVLNPSGPKCPPGVVLEFVTMFKERG